MRLGMCTIKQQAAWNDSANSFLGSDMAFTSGSMRRCIARRWRNYSKAGAWGSLRAAWALMDHLSEAWSSYGAVSTD